MRVETKQVFYADDGSMFENERACKEYEDSIKAREAHTSYWTVYYSPDLTEGRGHQSVVYLEAYIPHQYPAPIIWVEDWCIKTFGRKLSFVQGVSPMPSWVLSPCNREYFLKKNGSFIGSTRIEPKSVRLIVGNGESGLLQEEKVV